MTRSSRDGFLLRYMAAVVTVSLAIQIAFWVFK